MPLLFVRQDITQMQVDAIVNAANNSLLGGGGVDGAIHRAAGRELLQECRTLGGCKTGEAKRTLGYQLPCRYVIHTVGPVWHGGNAGEEALLSACYTNALRIAEESGCESVAFPLISAGIYGYPKEAAIRVAVRNIREFLQTHDMTVYLVLFDRASVDAAKERFPGLQQYIDDRSVREIEERFARKRRFSPFLKRFMNITENESASICEDDYESESYPEINGDQAEAFFQNEKDALDRAPSTFCIPGSSAPTFDAADDSVSLSPDAADDFPAPVSAPAASQRIMPQSSAGRPSLDDLLLQLDESFSEMLLRKIDEKGMTDAQCYKKANIDRKLFSKIRSNPRYKPSKSTALAFAIALELPLPEVREMLSKAGYALSRSSKFDVIVEYFIEKGDYDVFEINEALFSFDQNLLGA